MRKRGIRRRNSIAKLMRMISIAGPVCGPLTWLMLTSMRLKSMPAVAVGLPGCGPMPVGIGTLDLTLIRLSRAMGFSTVLLAGATIPRGSRLARRASGTSAVTTITSGRAIVQHMAPTLASPDTPRILAETVSLPVASGADAVVEVSAAAAEDSMAAAASTEEAAADTAVAAVGIAKRKKHL